MTIPLILQIQRAALDSKSSLTDALRRAKVASTKLGLTEFGNWVDLELRGYIDKRVSEIPAYRKLFGRPEGYDPYQGWQPIMFEDSKTEKVFSFAPVGMAIFAIEESLKGTSATGVFEFPYPADLANKLRKAIRHNGELRIRLGVPAVAGIIDAARNILLNWTIEMEEQGILGNDLTFSQDEREKSTKITEAVVNNIHIGQVGSFVQSATNSVVRSEINTTQTLAEGVHNLVQQVGQWLPVANLPGQVEGDARKALAELQQAGSSDKPDGGRLRKGLEALKRVVAPAGEHLLKIAIDAAVTRLLGP